ncbi:hypothetical protein TNCV_4947021, partial [Trichonephila clavipes]
INQISRIKREALKELKAILKWRNQHAGTVHRNSYAERSKVRPDANVSQAVSVYPVSTTFVSPNPSSTFY